METKIKKKPEKNIDGFLISGLKGLEKPLSIRELFMLKLLINIWNNFDLTQRKFGRKTFKWISPSIIFDRLENIKYTKKMFRNDMLALERNELIDRVYDKIGDKTMVYYHITEKTRGMFVFNII